MSEDKIHWKSQKPTKTSSAPLMTTTSKSPGEVPPIEDGGKGDDIVQTTRLDFLPSASALNQKKSEVKDKGRLVYFIVLLHGMGTLMPWNMFINAKTYFVNYKLSADYTNADTSTYAQNFLVYIGYASQFPNVLFNWINIFAPCRGSTNKRILLSLFLEAAFFIITILLASLDTSRIPDIFFWLTMLSVFIINTAGGIYQNSIYGIAATVDYTGLLIFGANLSGTFSSIMELISMSIASSPKNAAMFYFSTALITIISCIVTYLILLRNKFYLSKQSNQNPGSVHDPSLAPALTETETFQVSLGTGKGCPGGQETYSGSAEPPSAGRFSAHLETWKKCWPQCLNVFLFFFITLSVFPAVTSDVKRISENFIIPEKYFVGVTCFLTFNLFSALGSSLVDFVEWPGPSHLWKAVTLHALFIPFFIFCNYQPLGVTRTFTPHFAFPDGLFWFGMALLGFSNGFFTALAMIYISRSVERKHAPIASMLGAACLISGIFGGINFSLLMPIFVSKVQLG